MKDGNGRAPSGKSRQSNWSPVGGSPIEPWEMLQELHRCKSTPILKLMSAARLLESARVTFEPGRGSFN